MNINKTYIEDFLNQKNVFIITCIGTSFGDNFTSLSEQCSNLKTLKEKTKIVMKIERGGQWCFNSMSSDVEQYQEGKHKPFRILIDIVLFFIKKYNISIEYEFFLIKVDYTPWEEQFFVKNNCNKVCYSLGDVIIDKYMKPDLYNPILEFLKKQGYELVKIDYPMTVEEAEKHLLNSKFFVGNHSGLTALAEYCKIPYFVWMFNSLRLFSNKSCFFFNDYECFVESYYRLMNNFKSKNYLLTKTFDDCEMGHKIFKNNENVIINGITYEIDKFGIMHQKNHSIFKYDQNYINILKSSNDIQSIRLEIFQKNIPNYENAKCLEIGPGNGHFMKFIKEKIPNISFEATDIAQTVVSTITIENAKTIKYDVIFLFDVLEHFNDINELFEYDFKYAYISIPYIQNLRWLIKHQNYWHHLKPNEHLHHFISEYSFENWINSKGYTIKFISFDEDKIRIPKIDKSKNIVSYIIEKIY